ncbi:MAG: hypothetical protein C4293_18305 [Nitrospiraceae bacterium]
MPRDDAGSAPSQEIDLEAITRRALGAAERGDWETARWCYQQRETLLVSCELSSTSAQHLYAMDLAIHERARLAQTAMVRLLADLAVTHHALKQLAGSPKRGIVTGVRVDRQV